jgi:hypothetical protein
MLDFDSIYLPKLYKKSGSKLTSSSRNTTTSVFLPLASSKESILSIAKFLA